MIIISCIFVTIFISSVANCANNFYVFPSEAAVVAGEGLVLQVLPVNGSLATCSVRFGDQNLLLTPEMNLTQSVKYWGDSLQDGHCGAIISNFNISAHSGSWVFQLVTSNGINRTAKATINGLDENNYHKNITILGEMGKELAMNCSGYGLWYCILTNPVGEIEKTGSNCTISISNLKMKDVGQWKCSVGVSEAVREQVTFINVQIISVKTLDIGVVESEKESNIYCNHLSRELQYCRLERPDGKAFLMADGKNLGRYTYYGKGITASECGISIAKPLASEDYGTWMCTLGLSGESKSGGFVTILQKDEVNKLHSKQLNSKESISVLVGSSLVLDCAVDAALNYCWFKHPNGTRFNPHPDGNETSWKYDGDSLLLGKCGITLLEAQVSDSGTWTCGMGVQSEMQAAQDLEKTFLVTVAEIPFVENRTVTKAMTGDWAILGCHSLQGEALQYCSFLAPNGTGYNLTPGHARGRFSYYGPGLEYGHCGIMINSVQKEDYGMWQCGTMLAAEKSGETLVRNLYLQQPGLMSSSAIGLTVGVVVAVILAVGFLLYRRRRASHQQAEAEASLRPVALSMLSASSDEAEVVNQ